MLFRAGEVDSLITTVDDLLAQQACWDSMRQKGREFVEQERTWSNSVARYADVYGSLS